MMAAAERAPWMNPRILTTLMLVFLAGAATGALSMRLIHHPAPVNAQQNREAVLNRFRTQLDLDGGQVQKLSLLLDDYSQYYESLQEQLALWRYRAPGDQDFSSNIEMFPAASYQYVLFGMGFKMDLSERSYMVKDVARAGEAFQRNAMLKDKWTRTLPKNRHLIDKILEHGMAKV